jgi:hypothetical protein
VVLALDERLEEVERWRGVKWRREDVVAWEEGVRWWTLAVLDVEEDDLWRLDRIGRGGVGGLRMARGVVRSETLEGVVASSC